jgi:hypothetical protein
MKVSFFFFFFPFVFFATGKSKLNNYITIRFLLKIDLAYAADSVRINSMRIIDLVVFVFWIIYVNSMTDYYNSSKIDLYSGLAAFCYVE